MSRDLAKAMCSSMKVIRTSIDSQLVVGVV